MHEHEKNDFYIFIPSDLDLWPLDLKFVPVVTHVQRYVPTKLPVSTAFLLQKIGGTGQMDGRTVMGTNFLFLV